VYNDLRGHAILGTIIVALFLLQPLIGTCHHRLYLAGRSNRLLRLGHVWYGRLLIILAIVNGGTGLQLAENSPGGEKAYAVLAGVVGVVYLGVVVLWYWNGREKGNKEADAEGNGGESSDESGLEGGGEVEGERKEIGGIAKVGRVIGERVGGESKGSQS
jgi:hypothetical protein